MSIQELFTDTINRGYTFKKDYIILGGAMLDGKCIENTYVKIPLKTLNRHGLIAGATGTGKTKTLQIIAENLSEKGIPSLLMDMKGDLTGISQPGTMNAHIDKRHKSIGLDYTAKGSPIEILTLTGDKAVRLRATVSEFGPVLISKVLGLNEVQSGIIAIIFKYSDDNDLPLLDLKDLRKLLQYSIQEGKALIEKDYGYLSKTSVSTILRKIIELEQQGADHFFGEKSFDVTDLLKTDRSGNGIISIIQLMDIQAKPKLFSTFMLCLLAEIFSTFPEKGDSGKPKLCIFIDEAHLIFKNASSALLEQLEAIVKLIRSKGVGIYFCTQNPTDIPDAVLSQLGLKVQHALRAFTAKDRKMIVKTAENYPISTFYKTDEVLTKLGIGEAFVTALNEKGIPTPLAATYLRAPMSRMDIITDKERDDIIRSSTLLAKYNTEIDRKSAFEILTAKIEKAKSNEHKKAINEQKEATRKATGKKRGKDDGFIGELSKNTMIRQLGNTIVRELARGILGVLGVKR